MDRKDPGNNRVTPGWKANSQWGATRLGPNEPLLDHLANDSPGEPYALMIHPQD